MNTKLRGEWQLNGETIKISKTGRLLDGQHRCLAVVKSGVGNWQKKSVNLQGRRSLRNLIMSTSRYSSRPPQGDVGADTIRIPVGLPTNQRRDSRLAANLWVVAGIVILLCDCAAMAHFADSGVEACIVALLTGPAGIFVILAALEARK